MSDLCANVDAFFDGELTTRAAAEFRDHLATCEKCESDLHDLMMLAASTDEHADVLRATADRTVAAPIARHRRWPRLVAGVGAIALAAAAGWALLVRAPIASPPTTQAPVALLDATSRRIEARVSYPAADVYRPYDVHRAASADSREHVSLQALAALEAQNDFHGVAAGLLLAGDLGRASDFLERAGASADVDVERAVIAMSRGRREEALDVLDGVLAKNPKHPQALWNEAIVLRDLHLPLSAADVFDEVAAIGERGWRDEAAARAKAIRDEDAADQKRWSDATVAARAMVETGAMPSQEIVRAFPSYLRHRLYEALCNAPSRDRVQALVPIAIALDDGAVDGPLARHVKSVASRTFAPATCATETTRAGAARGEPWLALVADASRARDEERRSDFVSAERTLRGALATCEARHFDYLCGRIQLQLTDMLVRLYRTTDATTTIESGLRRTAANARDLNRRFQLSMGDLARLRTAFPTMKAYLHEAALRDPSDCEGTRFVYEKLAFSRLGRLDARGAHADLDRGPRCGKPITPLRAYVLSSIARMGEPSAELQSLRADIAQARSTLLSGEVATIDVIEGHFVLQSDPIAGAALVKRGLDESQKLPNDPNAAIARAFAYLTSALDAARAGRGAAAIALLAADAEAPGDVRCALAVAVDFERAFAAASDVDGETTVFYDDAMKITTLDPERLVPANVRARLAACPSVRVFAPAPVHGTTHLLPSTVAWSYRLGPDEPPLTTPIAPRRLFVSDVEAPASLDLPKLQRWGSDPSDDATTTWLHGASATPSRVLAALSSATEVEIHAHGLVDLGESDASVIVLSPDDSGRYALTAREIRAVHLAGRPIVVLGACRAAHVAPYYHEPWSLPLALMRSGARAVFASPAPVRDAEAGPFFDGVLARVRAGASPAEALRDERAAWLARGANDWISDVLAFD